MVEGLTAKEIERAKFAFSVYDYDGNETIDASNLGDLLRVLGLMPTLKAINNMGGTTKRGEKTFTIEEFLPIYSAAKKDRDKEAMDDVKEMFKLYDRDGNGYISGVQLRQLLLYYGEKLDMDEVAEIIKDCADPEDDEGQTRWGTFLKRVLDGPPDTKKKPASVHKIKPTPTSVDQYDMLNIPAVSFSQNTPKNGENQGAPPPQYDGPVV